MTTDREIVVIGGGPAGLATAIGLRRSRHEVVVIDRRQPPIDKACGEGLMPDGVRVLSELGVDLDQDVGAPLQGIRYIDGDVHAEARFRGEPGLGIRRTLLHQMLVERATQSGVELMWGEVVQRLDRNEVVTERGRIRARWIIGADGLHSRVRRWAGLSSKRVRFRRCGVRRHYSIAPWTDLVEVHWAEGCEAYVTPISGREVGVAFLWSSSKTGFAGLLKRIPDLERRLRGSDIVSRDRGAAQLEQRTRGVHRGSVALVGDAAGYRDAITGEGLSMAFHQAKALIGAIEGENLQEYEQAVRRLARLPNATIRLLLEIERRPWLRRRLIRTLAGEPGLFERLLAIHARAARPLSVGPSGLLRLAWGLLH